MREASKSEALDVTLRCPCLISDGFGGFSELFPRGGCRCGSPVLSALEVTGATGSVPDGLQGLLSGLWH
jgi:hypothetical protein